MKDRFSKSCSVIDCAKTHCPKDPAGMAYKPRGPPEVEKNRQKPRRVGLCEKYHRSDQSDKKFPMILNQVYRKKVGGKGGGGKAKPKFKSYAEARKDREKFRKKLVRKCDAEWITLVKVELIMVELIMVEMVIQVELIMHRSGDEDEDAEPENCAAPLTCKEKVAQIDFNGFQNF